MGHEVRLVRVCLGVTFVVQLYIRCRFLGILAIGLGHRINVAIIVKGIENLRNNLTREVVCLVSHLLPENIGSPENLAQNNLGAPAALSVCRELAHNLDHCALIIDEPGWHRHN
jgi:hypothetical protein